MKAGWKPSKNVDLHLAGQLGREQKHKFPKDSEVVEIVPPALFQSLKAAQETLHWVKRYVLPDGSGNQGPDVAGSNGLSHELQRVMREGKAAIRMKCALEGKSNSAGLCEAVEWLVQGKVGNCADNAQAAAVKLASLLNTLPDGVKLHLIEHSTLPDHAQLWMIVHPGAEPIIIDPWLVFPMIHLKSNEHKMHRFDLRKFPLATSGFADGRPYTKLTQTIQGHDPVYQETVTRIETGKIPYGEQARTLRTHPERATWFTKHMRPGNHIYDGSNWAVRRSQKVLFKNEETGELLDLDGHDFDDYFDQRLKMLMVAEFRLLTEQSTMERFPYAGGYKFRNALKALGRDDAKPLARLLVDLSREAPRTEEALANLLGELITLGIPPSEQKTAIECLCRHALADLGRSSTWEDGVLLMTMILCAVSSSPGNLIDLLPAVIECVANQVDATPTLQSKFIRCFDRLSGSDAQLMKDLIQFCAAPHSCLDGLHAGVDADSLLRDAAKIGNLGAVKWLLPMSTDHPWPILAAARRGHQDVVAALVENGAQLDDQDSEGRTALHFAAEHGQHHLVKLLLEVGADPDVDDHSGKAAWMLASNMESIQAFIDEGCVDWSATDDQGQTIWHQAIRDPDLENVATGLAQFRDSDGAINLPDRAGHTPLMAAASEGKHDMLAAFLVNPTVQVNKPGHGGESALMLACAVADSESVQLLLEHPDLDIHQTNLDGQTAIDICLAHAKSGDLEQNRRFLDVAKMLEDAAARGSGIRLVESASSSDND